MKNDSITRGDGEPLFVLSQLLPLSRDRRIIQGMGATPERFTHRVKTRPQECRPQHHKYRLSFIIEFNMDRNEGLGEGDDVSLEYRS